MQIFYEPTKICLIVGCTINRLLIDCFYENGLIGFKEIIDKINHASTHFTHPPQAPTFVSNLKIICICDVEYRKGS